jgi:hypothetical protein
VELIVAAILKDIENQALQLSSQERGALIRRLIVSLEGAPEDSKPGTKKWHGAWRIWKRDARNGFRQPK